MSDFLFLPKVIILSFFNFAFFLKKLKNLSSRFSIIVPFFSIELIISDLAFAIP